MDGPFNKIGAYTWAVGVELEVLSGTPVTTLVRNFLATDSYAEVQSTLGFPPSGYVWLGYALVHYSSKTPTRFVGITTTHVYPIPDQTIVYSDTSRQVPDSYELFWEVPWAGNNYGVDVEGG